MYLALDVYWIKLPIPPLEPNYRALAQKLEEEGVQPRDIFHYLDSYEAFCLHTYYPQTFEYHAGFPRGAPWSVQTFRDKNIPWREREYPDRFKGELTKWQERHAQTVLVLGGHFAESVVDCDRKVGDVLNNGVLTDRLYSDQGLCAYRLKPKP